MNKTRGREIALMNLNFEKTKEPMITASFCMKRDFFRHYTGKNNIYDNAGKNAIEAYVNAGANFCPQFIMPDKKNEVHAFCPVDTGGIHTYNNPYDRNDRFDNPEDVRDFIEKLPEIDTIQNNFDIKRYANNYASYLIKLTEMSNDEMLFIEFFGQADFASPLTLWGYDNYLSAILLYPEHLERFYEYTGEIGRLQNVAIAEAISRYELAPFVFSGQDICFNSGPLVDPKILNKIYFPQLKRSVEPLHDANIKIIWHCDGDVRELVDTLIKEIGVAGFQGFQEETGCTLDIMSSTKTRENKDPIIVGSVSVTTTLPYMGEKEVKKDVERCFDLAGRNGGFALSSSSSILPETPLENIITMYEHAKDYGRRFLSEIY